MSKIDPEKAKTFQESFKGSTGWKSFKKLRDLFKKKKKKKKKDEEE